MVTVNTTERIKDKIPMYTLYKYMTLKKGVTKTPRVLKVKEFFSTLQSRQELW